MITEHRDYWLINRDNEVEILLTNDVSALLSEQDLRNMLAEIEKKKEEA